MNKRCLALVSTTLLAFIIHGARGQGMGYRVGVVPSLEKVFKDMQFQEPLSAEMNLSLAQGEYESAQIVIVARQDLVDVRILFTELRAVDGDAVIEADNLSYRVVGYVISRPYSKPNDPWRPYPEPLIMRESFDVSSGENQPILITVHAPRGTPPGVYRGEIVVDPGNAPSSTVRVTVRVWDFPLPDRCPLWVVPWADYGSAVRYLGFGIDDHDKFLKFMRYDARLLARHNIRSMFIHPNLWKIEKVGDSCVVDFDYFDQVISVCQEEGIDRFCLFLAWDMFEEGWFPCSEESLLRKVAGHLREKGWLEQFLLYLKDEPDFSDPETLRKHKEYARIVKDAGFIYRGNALTWRAKGGLREVVGLQNVYIFADYLTFDRNVASFADERRSSGDHIWWYTCGYPGVDPTMIAEPEMKVALIPLISWKFNRDGYLFYAYNLWRNREGDPWEQKGVSLPWVVFPDPEKNLDHPLVPTMTLVSLRDGLDTYSYLWILDRLVKEKEAEGDVTSAEEGRSVIDQCLDRLVKFVGFNSALGGFYLPQGETLPTPGDLYQIRELLARTIIKLKAELGVEESRGPFSDSFCLLQNFPNPFNTATRIDFYVPANGRVSLRVYDVRGRKVRTLVDRFLSRGKHFSIWNGRDGLGRRVASGLYICRLTAKDFKETKKMLLLR